MANARPDQPDDRIAVRQQMDDFLSKVMVSDYARLDIDQANVLLTEAGAEFTQNLPPPNPLLTGANSAALPMTLSTVGITGDRISVTLLINPTTLNHGKTSAVYANYTRQGYVTQLWGPNQDLLTSTGTTAAFMVDGIGLTAVGRRQSFGMQNFFALFYAYRNNGYQLLDIANMNSILTRVINIVHGVEVSYDGQIFMGHFNNFTLDENADKPFLLDYNFEFVISSLSNNYEEIRGHFEPIPPAGLTIPYPARTTTDLLNRNS
jgi:hypothetical protein